MDKKSGNTLKKWLWGILLFGITVPLIQQLVHFANEKALKGSQEPVVAMSLTQKNWFDGTFQKRSDEYLNEQFGFRSSFVRLHNQLQFSLYRKIFTKGVILGEDNYLFEKAYIEAYHGDDFIGENEISDQVEKLRFLQDTLHALGKDLLVVLAPGKAHYHSEQIPKDLRKSKGATNYEGYQKMLQERSVNTIDAQKWFLDMKDTTPYPLYPKEGIHWSRYGEILVTDSISSWIRHKVGKQTPRLVVDNIELSSTPKFRDDDIGAAMNLMFQMQTEPLAYPSFHIEDPEHNSVRTSFIADSYFWGIQTSGLAFDLFGDGQFWFYNQQIHQTYAEKPINVSDVNTMEEILKNDVIVIMVTDANLSRFGFGFVEELYSLMKP